MAFRFNQASTESIAAFAEDYRVVKTPRGCHLTWVMAIAPNGAAARIGMSLGRPAMGWMLHKFLYTCAITRTSGSGRLIGRVYHAPYCGVQSWSA